MASVLIPLADGFEEIEAVTVIDVLRRGGVEVVTASIGEDESVAGAHGIDVKADAMFEDVADADYDAIVLPGGGEGVDNLKAYPPLAELLVRQKGEGRLICAICAAPTLLTGIEGLVDDGIHLTCYPTLSLELDRPCANAPAVEDGQFITGQAPGAAMIFALVVLRALTGDKLAMRVAAGLVTNVMQ